MPENYYRTGQAAKKLDISAHHMRKLCEAALIEADLSGGNQWRIPAAEVDRLIASGIPPIPAMVQTLPDEVEETQRSQARPSSPLQAEPSAEVQSAHDDLVITETNLKKRKLEREREEVEDFFRSRDQRAAAERAAQSRAQQQAAIEAKKRDWAEAWQLHALRSLLPDVPPEYKIEIHRKVAELLSGLDISHSRSIVVELVDAVVQKVLEPYHRRKETVAIIERAIDTLPYGARGWHQPTQWETRAKQAIAKEMETISGTRSAKELLAIAVSAVEPIVEEFKDREMRAEIRRGMAYWCLGDVDAEERKAALEAAAEAMAMLPAGTSRAALDKAVHAATDLIVVSAKERLETELKTRGAELIVDSRLRHVDGYIRREYEFDSPQDFAQTARDLKDDIRAELVELLVDDEMSPDEINGWIEDAVDELLA